MNAERENGDRAIKILTIDGGGLHALSVLSILNQLCDKIAEKNGTDRKPAPFELFDIICGIGTGGWLALLLGKYRLSIERCMSVYMKIADAIDAQMARRLSTKAEQFRFDQRALISTIDDLLNAYGLGLNLLDMEGNGSGHDSSSGFKPRCEYAFAAAAIAQPKPNKGKYEIFRAYRPKESARGSFIDGPDPARCKLSDACAATGAAKYILAPFHFGKTIFSDEAFWEPHNITSLALDEARYLYGGIPDISLVVNIGSGIPSQDEINVLKTPSSWRGISPGQGTNDEAVTTQSGITRRVARLAKRFSWRQLTSETGSRAQSPIGNADSSLAVAGYPKPEGFRPTTRSNTTSSSGSDSSMASEQNSKIREEIKERLDREYPPTGRQKYCHLGASREGDTVNDVAAPGSSRQKAIALLDEKKDLVEEAARQYGLIVLAC